MHQGYNADTLARQILADIAGIVGAIRRVEQMGTGKVAHALFNGHNAAQTAHMGGGQRVGRVLPAQVIVEQIKGEIMAAGAEDGPFHLSLRRHQFYSNHSPLFLALKGCRDTEHAVGLGQGGNGTSTFFKRHGHKLLADSTQNHAPEFFDPC